MVLLDGSTEREKKARAPSRGSMETVRIHFAESLLLLLSLPSTPLPHLTTTTTTTIAAATLSPSITKLLSLFLSVSLSLCLSVSLKDRKRRAKKEAQLQARESAMGNAGSQPLLLAETPTSSTSTSTSLPSQIVVPAPPTSVPIKGGAAAIAAALTAKRAASGKRGEAEVGATVIKGAVVQPVTQQRIDIRPPPRKGDVVAHIPPATDAHTLSAVSSVLPLSPSSPSARPIITPNSREQARELRAGAALACMTAKVGHA